MLTVTSVRRGSLAGLRSGCTHRHCDVTRGSTESIAVAAAVPDLVLVTSHLGAVRTLRSKSKDCGGGLQGLWEKVDARGAEAGKKSA